MKVTGFNKSNANMHEVAQNIRDNAAPEIEHPKPGPMESYKYAILDFGKRPKKRKSEPKYPLIEYDIWMEGYAATGESATATYLGKQKGRNFQDACMRYWFKEKIKGYAEADKKNEYYDTKRWDYDPYNNSYWACRLFQTEAEAREFLG